MPAPVPTKAIAALTKAQHPGSVRVTVMVKPRGRAFLRQVTPDTGAVVLLIPKGIRIQIPWTGIVPSSYIIALRHRLPPYLRNGSFQQAQAELRKHGGFANVAGAEGQAFFPSVAPGDYLVLILGASDTGLLARSAHAALQSGINLYPGTDSADSIIDRHFGAGADGSEQERQALRFLASHAGHEGEVSVHSGEETPYVCTF